MSRTIPRGPENSCCPDFAAFRNTICGFAVEFLPCAPCLRSKIKLESLDRLPPVKGKPIFEASFNKDGSPDSAVWNRDTGTGNNGWGNNEKQYYTDSEENAYVSNGTLKIKAMRTDRPQEFEGREFTSARLVSKEKWKYGRFEVVARLPRARGSWSAIWMLPFGFPTDQQDSVWPMCGEIDIMEHVGFDCGTVHGTVHTGKFNHTRLTMVGRHVSVEKVDEFHTYTIDWSESHIDFAIDGKHYHQFQKNEYGGEKMWPFDKHFHLLLNIAVGGTWGGMKGVDEAAFDEGQIMEIQSVRIWPRES